MRKDLPRQQPKVTKNYNSLELIAIFGLETWLNQPSFPAVVSGVQVASDTSDSSESEKEVKSEEIKPVKRKRKKEKRVKTVVVELPTLENDLFTIDAERDLGYLKMDKLAKRCMPRYERPGSSLAGVFAVKKRARKPVRYFSKKVAVRSGQDDVAVGEDLKKMVAVLNTAVRKNPTCFEDWMKLVYFQVGSCGLIFKP